ncbi:MAG: DUF5807 family protein [Haloarculaceae archaeon]
MTGDARAAFLRGDRPDDVLVYLPDRSVSDPDALADHGERAADGTVLVLPGERGRAAFQRATGIDPMTFAQRAMQTEGEIDPDCTGGTCPAADPGDPPGDHRIRFVFAFAEEQNEEAGGRYAAGDVVHAYAHCSCGAAYSDRWVVDED